MSILLLYALLVLSVFGFALRARRRGALPRAGLAWIALPIVLLSTWGALIAGSAQEDGLLSPTFLRLLPGLWLPVVPLVALVALGFGIAPLRQSLIALLAATPPSWLVALQGLRIAALGTLAKTLEGEFPLHFELGVGIPDLVFGLSAPLVAMGVHHRLLRPRAVAAWHAVGFAVVALPAPPLFQLGLPGPIQVFATPPTSEALLVYPMVLAPALVVPCFLALNLGCALWLWSRAPR